MIDSAANGSDKAGYSTCLYAAKVLHRRVKPRRHKLVYRLFTWAIDIDELTRLDQNLWLFSLNRFNLFSLYEGDFGDRTGGSLRQQVEALLAANGIELNGGRITLLAMPRLLGYVFNPISVYFCHAPSGDLSAIIFEVSNTFGERHCYVARSDGDLAGDNGIVRTRADKCFYVSPFIGMRGIYRFRVKPPGENVLLGIHQSDDAGALLHASLTGHRLALSDAALLRAFASFPMMTIKVMAGIHWEALRLWLKGVRLHSRPAPPASFVTVIDPLRAEGGKAIR